MWGASFNFYAPHIGTVYISVENDDDQTGDETVQANGLWHASKTVTKQWCDANGYVPIAVSGCPYNTSKFSDKLAYVGGRIFVNVGSEDINVNATWRNVSSSAVTVSKGGLKMLVTWLKAEYLIVE